MFVYRLLVFCVCFVFVVVWVCSFMCGVCVQFMIENEQLRHRIQQLEHLFVGLSAVPDEIQQRTQMQTQTQAQIQAQTPTQTQTQSARTQLQIQTQAQTPTQTLAQTPTLTAHTNTRTVVAGPNGFASILATRAQTQTQTPQTAQTQHTAQATQTQAQTPTHSFSVSVSPPLSVSVLSPTQTHPELKTKQQQQPQTLESFDFRSPLADYDYAYEHTQAHAHADTETETEDTDLGSVPVFSVPDEDREQDRKTDMRVPAPLSGLSKSPVAKQRMESTHIFNRKKELTDLQHLRRSNERLQRTISAMQAREQQLLESENELRRQLGTASNSIEDHELDSALTPVLTASAPSFVHSRGFHA